MLVTEYRPRRPVDLLRTVAGYQRGPRDPTMAIDSGVIWYATGTEQGAATLALRQRAAGEIRAQAWGSGAQAALERVPTLCGGQDVDDGFDAGKHPVVAAAYRRFPGLRLGGTTTIFTELAGSVLEQKVTGVQAFRAWRYLVTRFGEQAPGPTPRAMCVPPPAAGWRMIPSWAWHRAGVEPPQSRTISAAAARGGSIERALRAAGSDADSRDRVLTSLPGVGLWTSAEVRARSLGDPDAVSVGDYHLAHAVGYALTGARVDDDGMLELLQPWAGHRQRVIRLIRFAGPHEPRRGPRMTVSDHRHH